jgi:hypothetical protein
VQFCFGPVFPALLFAMISNELKTACCSLIFPMPYEASDPSRMFGEKNKIRWPFSHGNRTRQVDIALDNSPEAAGTQVIHMLAG